jgi:glycosyltransferase involved in cell wall biosynthesis
VLLVLRVPTDERNKEELARWLLSRACGAAASAAGAAGAAGAAAAHATGDGSEPRDAAPPPPAHGGLGATLPSLRAACIASGSTAGQCAPRALVLPLTSCPDLAQAWRSLPPIALLDEMLSASELPSLYAAADAFVLPSRGEGWDRPVTG